MPTSALGSGRHPGSETSVGLPGEQELNVRHSHMRPEPYHDELRTFRGETEQRRHCENGGTICVVAEYRSRHDMMTEFVNNRHKQYRRHDIPWMGAGDRILAASLSREPPSRARRRNFLRSPSSVVRNRRPFRGRRGRVGLNQPSAGTHLQDRGVDINTGRRGHVGLNQPYVGTHLE